MDRIKVIKKLELLEKNVKDSGLSPPLSNDYITNTPLKEIASRRGEEAMCGCRGSMNSHNHTFFSIMDGVASPEAMVEKSAMRGFSGVGITDHGTMGGVLRAGKAGKNWYSAVSKTNGRLISVKKDSVKKLAKNKVLVLCDQKWQPLKEDAVDQVQNGPEQVYVQFNPLNDSQYRVVCDSELGEKTPFKVVSGCELYISWEDSKHKKYNHITVYATGMKGHRALVLLTSIGSIPSRRYVGARGFFRPRVFVEDLTVAVKEAEGELIVTTGCPISITSEALRDGNLGEARRFFDWGVKTLPKGNFFAELHLCDTSLDFNPQYKRAEDKYHASLFNVPVSRFRLKTPTEALKYASQLRDEIRRHVLSSVGRLTGKDLPQEAAAENGRRLLQYLSAQNKASDIKSMMKDASSLWITEAGSTKSVFEKQQDGEKVEFLKDAYVETIINKILNAGGYEEAQKTNKNDPNCKTTDVQPEHTKKKKSGRKERSYLLDEDSTNLISGLVKLKDQCLTAISDEKEVLKDIESKTGAKKLRAAANANSEKGEVNSERLENLVTVLASVEALLYVAAGTAEREDTSTVIFQTLATALFTSALTSVEGTDHSSISIGRDLGYAQVSEKISSLKKSDLPPQTHKFLSLLFADLLVSEKLKPHGGSEDDFEVEWVKSPEGNWMEKINRDLVILAKEYDVPLLMATDSHMTEHSQIEVQDAIIKRGKRRSWHMSRPYAIPRAHLPDFLDDVGIDWNKYLNSNLKDDGNCAYRMLNNGVLAIDDIIESFGGGSMILEKTTSCGEFKWDIVVPQIKHENHPYYNDAKEILESGLLRQLLPSPDDKDAPFVFTDASINIPTAIIVTTFLKAVERKKIPMTAPYMERLFSEIHLSQEVGSEKLCDFFIVLQYSIERWRRLGISVGPGRGSSGGMLIAMVCGITSGDPIKKGFSQSRWMNKGRKAAKNQADIDIDVSDRKLAGLDFARVAKEAFDANIEKRPLTPLEVIFHKETFFSSQSVTHEELGGRIIEVEKKKLTQKEVLSRLKSATSGTFKNKDSETDEEAIDADSVENLTPDEDLELVIGTPTTRIGTHGSLKAKNAVKDAIRIADNTPYEDLPSAGAPTSAYISENMERFKGLSDDEIVRSHESETYGHLPASEQIAKRRVRKAERITKEMTMGAGLTRLYQNEQDFFHGSVYGVVPPYWDPSARPPSGSAEAAEYFKANPKVEQLVLDMLNIYKSQGVHAGGLCIGREVFERVPVRADKFGYVTQFEMKDVEYTGILKFDLLGLETLEHISETYKLAIKELPYEHFAKYIPESIYNKVKAGESTDYIKGYIPLSTPEAVIAMCNQRGMSFQIDTKVFGKELDKLLPQNVIALLERLAPNLKDRKNDILVDVLSVFLAIFRPGPMKLNSHTEYIDRLMGKDSWTVDPWLAPYVSKTLGLIAYQEQVMDIFQNGAGVDEETTDEVRRAMGKKDIKALEGIRAKERFLEGLKAQGVLEATANEFWEKIVPFAEYGFNLSHSWHYAMITAETLFLKAHFSNHFIRVMMSYAKAEDLARYLAEVSTKARMPCALRSEERLWGFDGTGFFPGLLSIDGIKKTEVAKIMHAQTELKKAGFTVKNIDPFTYFCFMGPLTVSFASLLSRSGLLRELGTPEEIAAGYEKAYLAKFQLTSSEPEESEAEAAPEGLEGLNFEPETAGKEKEKKGKKEAKVRKPKVRALNKEGRDVKAALIGLGVTYVDYVIEDDASKGLYNKKESITVRSLTVESALELVTSTKTKGMGIRHLLNALTNRENNQAQKEGRKPVLYVSLKELKAKKQDNGFPLSEGTYRTVGIVRNISSTKNYRTEQLEPRITFISEGTDLSLKFSTRAEAEQIDQWGKMLKDEKMKTPFIVDVYLGNFTAEGRQIAYFKIENIAKIT